MMTPVRLPFYLKIAQVITGIIGLFYILYLGQNILLPIIFAMILSILLNPMVNFLVRKKWNRILAISVSIIFMFAIVFGILYFIAAQMSMFTEALPALKAKLTDLIADILDWFSHQFRIPQEQMDVWIEKMKTEGMNEAGVRVGSTLLNISNVLVLVFLVPVYIFLILYYKQLFLMFFSKVFTDDKADTVKQVLSSTKSLIQSYLRGLIIEMIIVAALNSGALLIIGVEYGIVLGVIGAILNLIPYLGGIVAIALPMLMAFVNGTPTSALFVLVAYVIIQLIDNNILVPMIVASKVKVNALVSIVVVLIGGAVWGVAGMFLAIPLTAIIKVVCDNIPALVPYGMVIGDDIPTEEIVLPEPPASQTSSQESSSSEK
jgi:predicted PurR-regulated permease PerM